MRILSTKMKTMMRRMMTMSEYICYYKGEVLDPTKPKKEQLLAKGMTEPQIDLIDREVYTASCCDAFDSLECTRPIIDYGVPALRGYQAAVARVGDGKSIYDSWVVWDYCPFCGKPLAREIHPGYKQCRVEDY